MRFQISLFIDGIELCWIGISSVRRFGTGPSGINKKSLKGFSGQRNSGTATDEKLPYVYVVFWFPIGAYRNGSESKTGHCALCLLVVPSICRYRIVQGSTDPYYWTPRGQSRVPLGFIESRSATCNAWRRPYRDI